MTPDSTPGATYGFIERQLALVGNREPVEVLAATPAALQTLLADHGPEAFAEEAVPGKWRPIDILLHLLETEWVFGFRVRTLVCDAEPTITPVDQDAWVERQRRRGRTPAQIVAGFSALRHEMLALWRDLTPDDLAREGRHAGAGMTMSVGFLCRLQAGHDLNHLGQLREYLERIASRSGSS